MACVFVEANILLPVIVHHMSKRSEARKIEAKEGIDLMLWSCKIDNVTFSDTCLNCYLSVQKEQNCTAMILVCVHIS